MEETQVVNDKSSKEAENTNSPISTEEIVKRRKEKLSNFFNKFKSEGEPAESSNEDSNLMDKRKKKLTALLLKNYSWIALIFLGIIVWMSVKIRTKNLEGLRDVTTGAWTLGPDLDPFLFMRWAKYIVENGSLMVVDTMRYVPNGFKTSLELLLHPYLIAWFHNVATFFGSESVEQSAAIFPVFMFAITVIAFFLMTRKMFLERLGPLLANAIGLVAAFFLTVLPSLLPRTIAGIPEKESSAFFFMFMAFFFFLSAWKAKNRNYMYLNGVLAGIFTAGMALIWGGFGYIYLVIAFSTLIAFMLGQVSKDKLIVYVLWMASSLALMIPFSARYTFTSITASITTAPAVFTLGVLIVHFAIYGTKAKRHFDNDKLKRFPRPLISVSVAILLGVILSMVFFGPGFLVDKFDSVSGALIKPAQSRLIQTVAENRQPYFTEWSSSFGPEYRGFPVFFWLFFVGSIFLFYSMIESFTLKERIILCASYFVFLVAIIFSRYKQNHTLNGESTTSLAVYFGGILFFLCVSGYYYYKYYFSEKKVVLGKVDFGWLLIFVFFILGIVSARGAVRLIMILVPPTSIIVAFIFVVGLHKAYTANRQKQSRWIIWGVVLIIVIFTIYAGNQYYKGVNSAAAGYVPSIYNHQWQRAMQWTRDNTQKDAVFGHWWDYGYWVQSIGERATVLDGGNVISYWNHYMGRYALTGDNDRDALEFLYAHDTTHFLIDSTDIGKYAAFSTIGSDITYDRRSWIPTMLKDNSQTQERKNTTLLVYPGGTALDDDIIFDNNGTEVILPGGAAGLAGILVEKEKDSEIIQGASALFVYQGTQYNIPVKWVYFMGKVIEFEEGYELGVMIIPMINDAGAGQIQIDMEGAMIYLSERTVNSRLARYYLFGEESDGFRLAHTEDDFLISDLKRQSLEIGDFVHYRGLRGPIKIWELHYPDNITKKEEYLETVYPESLKIA